jgi:RND family efflux transporter MFP subunit
VKEGEVLAELENKDILATLEEARATSWVAELTAERDRKLVESQIGSQADYDLSLAKAEEAAARVKNLEEAVESTNVRAPFDGRIIVKNGEVGETVSLFGGQTSRKSGPIFVIAAFNEFEVEADVNESNIGKVEEGQPAEVELIAVPQKRYAGRLRQIVPTADRQKATIQAKVEILDPDEKVFPEMSAKVTFLKSAPAASGPIRVLAPAESIVERDGRRVSFVVEEGHVRSVPVATGPADGRRVTIQSGLSGGETVVLSPPKGLADGGRVRIRK